MRRPGRPARFLLALLPILGLALFVGCENAYDVEALYPLRKDWIVTVESLEGTPIRINPPGVLPVAALDGRTGLEGVSDGLLTERDKKKIVDPRTVVQGKTAEELMLALRDVAGRPRYPKIDTNDDAVNARLETELKLDHKTLAEGSILYRKNCLHCHGLTGDGRGPTGTWINPHPRDFRQGAFKYTSSGQPEGERKPRHADLKRILVNGIEGTAMPSFALLKPEQHDALIAYVTHLSIRGESEMETIKELVAESGQSSSGDEPVPIHERVRKWAKVSAERWLAAGAAEIKPTPDKIPTYYGPFANEADRKKGEEQRLEAAARGYKFFNRVDQCVQCHVNQGRDADYRYDTWGTIVKPRNLLSNTYGGGRRPIDHYWRIHSGIRGSGMPALIAKPEDLAEKEAHIWDLVAFLQVLPYPEERAKLRQAPHKILLD